MTSPRDPPEIVSAAGRDARPSLREWRFWAVQAVVVAIAGVHLLVDLNISTASGAFPAGIPVAILVVPVGYAALRYGLAGGLATSAWATLLWLPDLILPKDHGHVGGDLVDLALIDVVAFVFGRGIELERLARGRIERATAERLGIEAGYRHLFEANASPILVLDARGTIHEANPAASAVLGPGVIGRAATELFADELPVAEQSGKVVALADGRDYRVGIVTLPAGAGTGGAATQVVLEDVTEERSERDRATRYAALVVDAEEDQRRRLARELHDEPLQLFLHLARRLESLGGAAGVPVDVSKGLDDARRQALDAAARLRTLARDLRPPALDQLGLVPALSSLLADIEAETGVVTDLDVTGATVRTAPDIELGAFRIVQESARNSVRHAGARHFRVTVAYADDELTLTAGDDGRGFDPGSVDAFESGHLGLLGMVERANVLGGHLEVRSAPGTGTVVEATLPLRAVPNARRGPR
ncbi:MAG TPA: ATP-binding protein [Acidimicrobiales bacterium]|nr:ATP-binding protein [Acidimicrobiales bacterium]